MNVDEVSAERVLGRPRAETPREARWHHGSHARWRLEKKLRSHRHSPFAATQCKHNEKATPARPGGARGAATPLGDPGHEHRRFQCDRVGLIARGDTPSQRRLAARRYPL